MPDTGTDKELQDLGKRIHEARVDAGLVPDPEANSDSGRGMATGLELGVAVIVCSLGGVGLDRWLETTPLFMLLGLIVGFVAGMWNMYRSSVRESANADGNKQDE